jgi:hypothetical protein
MNWTRLSFFYLFGYLTFGGLGLLAAPSTVLPLMLANGQYGEVMPRVAGALMLALAIIVLQIIRLRVEVLYSTTLLVRVFLCVCLGGFYVAYRDPFFLVIVGIVLLGMTFTTLGFITDRRKKAGT